MHDQILKLTEERKRLVESVAEDDFWLEHMNSLISCEEQQRIIGDQLCAADRIEYIDRELGSLRAALDGSLES